MAAPRVVLTDGNPLAVLARCKAAAVRADWNLRQWVEFSKTARSCFTPEALPEENAAFLDVVRSHFEVELSETYNADPTQWRHDR